MIDTKAMEDKWKKYWFNNDIFKFKKGIKNYTIDTQAPSISGLVVAISMPLKLI